jgi:hypothetical protein
MLNVLEEEEKYESKRYNDDAMIDDTHTHHLFERDAFQYPSVNGFVYNNRRRQPTPSRCDVDIDLSFLFFLVEVAESPTQSSATLSGLCSAPTRHL